ncbi:MAG: DEAD/DEAH box helicase [Candidatus Hadarchaeum sp.]|uniref:DEAD/DEAH box helicase n=1 Tax=Candidatus Hadarchaeum sp. TaxID=2883567 RepID=UPI003D1345F5
MAANAFDLLAKPLRRLLEEMGFREPTLPQQAALPRILEGKNVLLISPAGTGKTEAAFLPALHLILTAPAREPGIKIIYITPLRALNRDLLDRLGRWCRELDLRVSVRHGDTANRERRLQALIPPDVMITTPETLQILLLGRRLRNYLRSVRLVIVDEVHELADNKRGAQLAVTLERLRNLKGGDFQVIGLSATIGAPEEVAKFLVGRDRNCEIVDVSVAREVRLSVIYPTPKKEDEALAAELYTFPAVAARLRAMRGFIERHGSTLVFTNTRATAEVLASRFHLWDVKFPIGVHHGSLSAFTRLRGERGLKQGGLKGLICTSSMELGLDIGGVDLVIQYNSPRQATRLLQRVGRSGHRIGEISKGVIIVQDPDDALESIVIAARSHEYQLEPVQVPEKPLDVLLHFLASILASQRSTSVDEAYETVRRAYPFQDLTREELLSVLRFAQSLEKRLLWVSDDGREFSRPRSTERLFDYYYSNLSMIPELKQYLVIDDQHNRPVGILDESFIAEYGEPGVKFIIGGELWKIIQVFRDKVFVKPDRDPVGAIPTWIGEEIPVPFSVAQEVGRIRGRAEGLLKSGRKFEEVVSELAAAYRAELETVQLALADVHQQVDASLPVPTDLRLTVEKVKDICVVNACFGTLVNRTLARVLAHRASEETGEATATTIDPYRILVRSRSLEPDHVVALLRERLAEMQRDVRKVIEESRFFRWRLAQVARRMGVLEKEAEITSSALEKLSRALRGTPVFEETFKEVERKDLDLRKTLEVLEMIKNGEIEVVSLGRLKEPSPISKLAWAQRYLALEPVMPERTRLLALAAAKARLLSEARTFACTDCRKYVREFQIHELEEKPRCPNCGSSRLGMVEEAEEEVRRAIELVERGREVALWKEMLESAKLIAQFGKLAALGLAGRGLTPAAVREILAKEPRFSNRFLELVLKKERELLFRKFKWSG